LPLRRLSAVSGGHALSPERADSRGVSLPPRVLRQRRHRAYRVSASPSLPFLDSSTKVPGQPGFEVFTPPPAPSLSLAAGHPLSGFGSPSECHQHTTASIASSAHAPDEYALPAPSEVSSPAACCQPWGATYPGESHLIRLRCALRVFHPLDALLPPWPARPVSSWIRSWG
jgi:hypothetical protein